MINYHYVRTLESEGKWEEALKFWKTYGDYTEGQMNIKAIELIIKSNRLGDAYRALVAPYNEQLEKRLINIYEHSELIREAHKSVYGG